MRRLATKLDTTRIAYQPEELQWLFDKLRAASAGPIQGMSFGGALTPWLEALPADLASGQSSDGRVRVQDRTTTTWGREFIVTTSGGAMQPVVDLLSLLGEADGGPGVSDIITSHEERRRAKELMWQIREWYGIAAPRDRWSLRQKYQMEASADA